MSYNKFPLMVPARAVLCRTAVLIARSSEILDFVLANGT